MCLHFPNNSRNYNAAKNTVTFWGSDRALELTFVVDRMVLIKMAGEISNEAGFLAAFDTHREAIEKAGARAYSRDNKLFQYISVDNF
jgi:hypothetical protein